MYDHDSCHAQCEDVHEIRGRLEDDGVGELNTSCIALRLDAGAPSDTGYRTHQRAHWQRAHPTY